MKNRVLILANDTTYVYNLRFAIIEKFIEKNFKVYIAAEVLEFKEELEKVGCHLIDIKMERRGTNPISDIKLVHKYKMIVKNIKPNFILSYNIKPDIYGGIACKRLKTNFMPNITGLGTALEYPGVMQKLTMILYKIGLKKAKTVFFQNQDNMQFFKERKILSKKTKMVLLPGSGVDLKRHKLLEYPMENTIKFLYIARIMKDKGIDIYLETAKAIKEKYPNTEFHICGYCDDEKYKEILAEYEKNKIIIYHGEQKDLIPFFKIASAIVHPSFYPEGMSNVLLEAAAHGRPIICTNRAGCRETVDEGITGFIVPVKNTNEVIIATEKIIQMNNVERKQMGIQGRKKMEQEFDRNIVVKKYMEQMKKYM